MFICANGECERTRSERNRKENESKVNLRECESGRARESLVRCSGGRDEAGRSLAELLRADSGLQRFEAEFLCGDAVLRHLRLERAQQIVMRLHSATVQQ